MCDSKLGQTCFIDHKCQVSKVELLLRYNFHTNVLYCWYFSSNAYWNTYTSQSEIRFPQVGPVYMWFLVERVWVCRIKNILYNIRRCRQKPTRQKPGALINTSFRSLALVLWCLVEIQLTVNKCVWYLYLSQPCQSPKNLISFYSFHWGCGITDGTWMPLCVYNWWGSMLREMTYMLLFLGREGPGFLFVHWRMMFLL